MSTAKENLPASVHARTKGGHAKVSLIFLLRNFLINAITQ